MITDKYTIAFTFELDNGVYNVPLTADVEKHHSEVRYVIKNIRTSSYPKGAIIPDVCLKKVAGRWMHCDSYKETQLSVEIGKAIDAFEQRV